MKLTRRQLNVLIESLLYEEEAAKTNQPAYQRNIKRDIENLINTVNGETKGIDVNIRTSLVKSLKDMQQKSDALIAKGDKEGIKKLINPVYGELQGYRRDGNIPDDSFEKFNSLFKAISREANKLDPSKGKKQSSGRKANKTVKEIQKALNNAGYKGKDGTSPLVVDGIFGKSGSNTDHAYKEFIKTNYQNQNNIHFVTGLGKGAQKSKLHTSNIGANGWRWGDVVDLIDNEGKEEVRGKYKKTYEGLLNFINDVEGAQAPENPNEVRKAKWKNREKVSKKTGKDFEVADLAKKLTSTGLNAKYVYDHNMKGAPSKPANEIKKADIATKFEAEMSSALSSKENIVYGGESYPSYNTSTSFTYNPETKILIVDIATGDYFIQNVDFIPTKEGEGVGFLVVK